MQTKHTRYFLRQWTKYLVIATQWLHLHRTANILLRMIQKTWAENAEKLVLRVHGCWKIVNSESPAAKSCPMKFIRWKQWFLPFQEAIFIMVGNDVVLGIVSDSICISLMSWRFLCSTHWAMILETLVQSDMSWKHLRENILCLFYQCWAFLQCVCIHLFVLMITFGLLQPMLQVFRQQTYAAYSKVSFMSILKVFVGIGPLLSSSLHCISATVSVVSDNLVINPIWR